jgi:hypothetical protein
MVEHLQRHQMPLVSSLLLFKLGKIAVPCHSDQTLTDICRPDLSWRDIQHLCVHTAQLVNPDDPDWEATAAGRRFSYKYGYGKVDAYDYVMAAKTWKNVKPQAWFNIPAIQIAGGTMNIRQEMSGGELIVPGGVSSSARVTKSMMDNENFEKLEHINVKVWVSHTRRGDVEVELVSPGGIKSVLAAPRRSDAATTGYPGWTFMSVKHWSAFFRLPCSIFVHSLNILLGTRILSVNGLYVYQIR